MRKLIAGRYELIRDLARGGMGSVWRARHVELELDVAIKLIGKDLLDSAIALERFRREARAAAVLRSPHVVQILDYGVEDSVPYLAMELLDGEDLRTALTRHGAVSHERAVTIVNQVAKALRLAHEAKIVHRDLKPGNIFLSVSSGEEVVKVLDFGVAKVERAGPEGAQTTTGTLIGSPLYMSPEQARGAHVDHRTDLWALAMVAYELVSGQHPLRGSAIGEILVKICTEDLPPPSSLGVHGKGLDEFFARALARDPEARFQSAKELAAAFASIESTMVATPLATMGKPDVPAVGATTNGVTLGHDQTTAGLQVQERSTETATPDAAGVRPRRSSLWLAPLVAVAAITIGLVAIPRIVRDEPARATSVGIVSSPIASMNSSAAAMNSAASNSAASNSAAMNSAASNSGPTSAAAMTSITSVREPPSIEAPRSADRIAPARPELALSVKPLSAAGARSAPSTGAVAPSASVPKVAPSAPNPQPTSRHDPVFGLPEDSP